MDEGKVIIEAKDSGGVRIALRPAEDGSIWMNIREIADIFNVGGASVERQIKKIFAEGELHEYAVRKDMPIEYAPGKHGWLDYACFPYEECVLRHVQGMDYGTTCTKGQ